MCLRGKKRKAFLIIQIQSGSIARDYELRRAGTHPFILYFHHPQAAGQITHHTIKTLMMYVYVVIAGGYVTGEIPMNAVAKGVYIVNLITDAESVSSKIVKF